MREERVCRLIKPGDSYDGRQGLTYFGGISAESTGAQGIFKHMLRMPPGARAHTHLHAEQETTI